jgi:hypothetical protein
MRLPVAFFSDHLNSQTSVPSGRAFEVRLPYCIAILPARSGGTGKIFSDLSDEKHDSIEYHLKRQSRRKLAANDHRGQLSHSKAAIGGAAHSRYYDYPKIVRRPVRSIEISSWTVSRFRNRYDKDRKM